MGWSWRLTGKSYHHFLKKIIIHIDIAIYYWIDWFIFRYCQIVVNFIEIVFFNSYSLFSIFYLHNLYQRYFSFLSLQLAPPIHVMAVVMDNFSWNFQMTICGFWQFVFVYSTHNIRSIVCISINVLQMIQIFDFSDNQ